MEYCYYVWVDASNCHLDMLNKIQKRYCRTGDPLGLRGASLESLAQCRIVDNLICSYYSEI